MTIQFQRQHLGFAPGATIATYPVAICIELIRRGVAREWFGDRVETKPMQSAGVVTKQKGKRK